MTEFLPLCDILFNVISLAAYFCDIVFDLAFAYAIYERGRVHLFVLVLCIIFTSLIASQVFSIKWYVKRQKSVENVGDDLKQTQSKTEENNNDRTDESTSMVLFNIKRYSIYIMHLLQLGVFWRYAKLFIPIEIRFVKYEVRELCLLRLIHGFCEAAPMLLLQMYVYVSMYNEELLKKRAAELQLNSFTVTTTTPSSGIVLAPPTFDEFNYEEIMKDLIIISSSLSLFSICWALASYTKNIRLRNVHRLVLTWLGVIFQFLWRLGTVAMRMTALVIYASVYHYMVFVPIIMHWLSMILMLLSPRRCFQGERISRGRKTLYAILIAYIYIFDFINVSDINRPINSLGFYAIMMVENVMLICLAYSNSDTAPDDWYNIPLYAVGMLLGGLAFMILYYRYFHIRRLAYANEGNIPGDCKGTDTITSISECRKGKRIQNSAPGVFNCRFTNPVGGGIPNRKKKKPTTFIPPPTLNPTIQETDDINDSVSIAENGLMAVPFWRRPIPRSHTGGSSENEGSVSSRVNIQQKLQEKKQKQLAELKVIEEEIKQGKLGGPNTNNLNSGDDSTLSLMRQPIPKSKKHINDDPVRWSNFVNGISTEIENYNNLNIFGNTKKFPSDYNPMNTTFGLNSIDINTIDTPNTTNSSNENGYGHRAITQNVNSHLNLSAIPPQINRDVSTGNYSSHGDIFLHKNRPREISGTYSIDNDISNTDNLPFPYNVKPPPKNKLDSNSRAHNYGMQGTSQISEVVLSPHYLESDKSFNVWRSREPINEMPNVHRTQGVLYRGAVETIPIPSNDCLMDSLNHSNGSRGPSDIDSQMSLPRSYTLPREFKYYKKGKVRKTIKKEQFVNSNNSSDGDVDSGDENESESYSNQSSNCGNSNDSRVIKNRSKQRSRIHMNNPPTSRRAGGMSRTEWDHLRQHSNFLQRNNLSPVNYNPQNELFNGRSKAGLNNFDLISSVIDVNGINRQSRMRRLGGQRNGTVRPETKL